MKLLPPVKPYCVLDAGCGEGKDAVFLAKCGYIVTAFDISQTGLEKAKRLAEHNRVDVGFVKADIADFQYDVDYDVIFSSGVLRFVRPENRADICDSMKAHTAMGGFNVLNVFVKKPFITRAPDSSRDESLRHPWRSGELFGITTTGFFTPAARTFSTATAAAPRISTAWTRSSRRRLRG